MSDRDKKKQVDQASLEATKKWLQAQRGNMPSVVADTLAKLISLYQTLVLLRDRRQKMQTLLKQFFGLEPKSERGRSGPRESDVPRKGKKLTAEEKAARKQKMEQKRQEDATEVEKIYAESYALLASSFAQVDKSTWKSPLEASAESSKTLPADASADAGFVRKIVDSKLRDEMKPQEVEELLSRIRTEHLYAFLQCSTMTKTANSEYGSMSKAFPDQVGLSLQSDYHTRTIWDVDIVFTRTEVKVETVTDRVTGERRVAPVDLAPPNWRHSYGLIAFFVMMVVNFLTPMTRLSRMFRTSEKSFPVATIWNMVRFAANAAEPVYRALGRQLGQVGYIEGDDTGTRCHQMKKSKEEIEDEKKASSASEEPTDPDPFANDRPLVDRVSEYMGRFFAGTTVDEKSGIHLSLVTGCANEDDERSRIVFYRTHRGTVSDLLGVLWSFDKGKKRRKVKFTCDLNSQNIPAERLRKHIDLTIGGCVAHLRRGFRAGCKLESAFDDCRYVLQLIRRLYDIERMAREGGNTFEHIHWYRQRYGKLLWDLIFEKIEEMSKKWLKNTGDLGDHIAYALKNRKAFMVYLDDPRMPIDNNFSERNLRPEKVHMANSRQRLTEEGRVAFDILLTVIRTCVCAQISPQEWLIWVMKNKDQVKLQPERYTPYQFRALQQKTKPTSGD